MQQRYWEAGKAGVGALSWVAAMSIRELPDPLSWVLIIFGGGMLAYAAYGFIASPKDEDRQKPIPPPIPDLRTIDSEHFWTIYHGNERDRLLSLLSSGDLKAWARPMTPDPGRNGRDSDLVPVEPSDWPRIYLDKPSIQEDQRPQVFLKRKSDSLSIKHDLYLNQHQFNSFWHSPKPLDANDHSIWQAFAVPICFLLVLVSPMAISDTLKLFGYLTSKFGANQTQVSTLSPKKMDFVDLFYWDFPNAAYVGEEYIDASSPQKERLFDFRVYQYLDALSEFYVVHVDASADFESVYHYVAVNHAKIRNSLRPKPLKSRRLWNDVPLVGSNMVFSNLIYFYWESSITPAQKDRLESVFSHQGITVIFRGKEYLLRKRREYGIDKDEKKQ